MSDIEKNGFYQEEAFGSVVEYADCSAIFHASLCCKNTVCFCFLGPETLEYGRPNAFAHFPRWKAHFQSGDWAFKSAYIKWVFVSYTTDLTRLIIIHSDHIVQYIRVYRQTSNICRILVGNVIVDHWDVVGASPVGAALNTSSFSTGFNGVGKDNCKTGQDTFKFWDLVGLILEVWQQILMPRLTCFRILVNIERLFGGTSTALLSFVFLFLHDQFLVTHVIHLPTSFRVISRILSCGCPCNTPFEYGKIGEYLSATKYKKMRTVPHTI